MTKRLQEERKKLGYNQSYVSDYIGVAVPTLSNYEKGKRSPDLTVLIKMSELGYDINYVITGKRDENHLNNEERYLLDLFRQADAPIKKHVIAGLMTGVDSYSKNVSVGDSNSGFVIGGDINR